MVNLDGLGRAVIEGDTDAAFALTKKALEANVPASEILDKGLIPGLREVGDLFEKGEYFLPELIVSGDAVAQALELLAPVLSKEDTPHVGKFLIGTVQGDVHDLGKNIVIMMLKGNGWEVTDLGVDISPEEFCAAIDKGDFQVLGMSSLLTMTMPSAVKTIETLKAAGLRDKVKIMVGGAPTTPEWADKIGADAYAKDGPTAAKVAATLVGKS
ncbi:MAG: cobalamin-binding protein [Dehalococcoidia bacterium]|nr:MAG: cobalamin-binding protein [Dehalococcoidia bacterium]